MSSSNLLCWLEQETNWGTNRGELTFITGRLGELYTAIMTNGEMASKTNQEGYDVVSEQGEHISVKSTTSNKGTHHFRFNKTTLNKVDRVVIVYINVEELTIQIIYDAPIEEAKQLMVETSDGSQYNLSQSKLLTKSKSNKIKKVVMDDVHYELFTIQKLESGTIVLLENGKEVTPVKPVLRKIAQKMGVDINNGNGNLKTTRGLGNDIIKQLKNN
ncbi:hypothetical protein BW731_02265 [Vagococcus martis]|uniref:DUF6998 domain-containing protein n=1 Tax=Vagococcus martis TaxID=1768210 RepID=A0A1V4DFB4_9ENTE|nr:hypothetical protein [Vagococcus martis]OPF87111.1 hypothetical protein BW731_02265 [Vagococcus martis]